MKNAGNGLLIGPKTWDQIVRIFFEIFEVAVTAQKMSGLLVLKLCNKMHA